MRISLIFILLFPFCSNSQIITTVAGDGAQGFGGDGAPATSAQLDRPAAIAFNRAGEMYVVDGLNTRLRKINTSGIITTVAGDGTAGSTGDGGPASAARVRPLSVVTDTLGNVYISEYSRIRRIDVLGIITTIAGGDTAGYNGDDIVATSASVAEPYLGFVDETGAIWFSDKGNHRIRKIDNGGIITTIAGTGTNGTDGDGGPATAARLAGPLFLSRNKDGVLLIPDVYARRTRKIVPGGTIEAFAGYGAGGSTGGDGGPALSAAVAACTSVACDDSGNAYLAMGSADVVRKVNSAGIISTIAGSVEGFGGDGGAALSAKMNSVVHISMYNGSLYVADMYNNRIRRITLNDQVQAASEIQGRVGFSMYPNPARDIVVLSGDKDVQSVAAIDVSGCLITLPFAIVGTQIQVDVSALPTGIYNVVVNGAGTGKLLKL